MKTDRLFTALVLGGAALGLGCTGASEDGPQAEPRGMGGGASIGSGGAHSQMGGTGGSTLAMGGSAGLASVTGGSAAGTGDAGAGGTVDGGRAGDAGAGGTVDGGRAGDAGAGGTGDGGPWGDGGALECSTPEDPNDPCGCPCCWVPGCLNNEECCNGFCESGDDSNGCCP